MKKSFVAIIVMLAMITSISLYNSRKRDMIIEDEIVPEGIIYELNPQEQSHLR